ncbi:protein POLLEN DEFECTIVE IN GUIDANCE 1 isoform X2 [Amaranthus tricolor]|uniref:protein POLLEN DEFECTIVE IN GUIDANCE 1 isoform X2 n=1 Tax=Amaranthus tricolor TaxID=29722 RepID=UPI002585B0D4|nr:protein POLLEN DEFECTIVE IN GUIDANCE 1 isoform X2 [Amaranthus tricolor]
MRLKSKEKQLSFEILSSTSPFNSDDIIDRANSDPLPHTTNKSNRRKRKSKRKKSTPNSSSPREINTIFENGDHFDIRDLDDQSMISHSYYQTCTICEVREERLSTICQVSQELRQRNVGGSNGDGGDDLVSEVMKQEVEVEVEVNSRPNLSNGKLENANSLDWKRFMAEDPNYPFHVENSPLKFLVEELDSGNALRSTTTLGNEKERERVYDTIFRLPWRCELLIDVGFFVCLNSFLSLLTIIPTRALVTLWRFFTKRQPKTHSAAELSDFGCLLVLFGGITLLGRTDISLIYHMIRGQGIIKLYVFYNVLEIFDKLWQSFGGDVFQTLFNSAERLACSSPESSRYWLERYLIDLVLAAVASIVHSFILLVQAVTLSTCIVAHNNALLALLVSNNFAEIKSNVFKRFSKDNVHSIVYSDSIERFHITAFLIFVLAQNIQEAEGPWFRNFLSNAFLVYFSEIAIDVIKHSFIAKFNDIKPIVYSEFLEELCKQTMNIQTEGAKKMLTFVPLAPACVVTRVLTPVFTARLPCSPLPWRLFWMICLTMITYVMLVSLKVMVGMGLQKHAAWYIKRCQRRKLHSD